MCASSLLLISLSYENVAARRDDRSPSSAPGGLMSSTNCVNLFFSEVGRLAQLRR
jgi:hypothetical protein